MKSAAIVSFIGNLMPSYHSRSVDGSRCAESLDDGTLIFPVDQAESDLEDGWVIVRWQADPTRQSEMLGDLLATIAVVRHVQLHYAGQPAERLASELEMLAQHYEIKTGGSLYLPYERVPTGVAALVRKAMGRLGERGLIELLTKAVGV